jgi:exodeoxyribonuclease V alpha subunit
MAEAKRVESPSPLRTLDRRFGEWLLDNFTSGLVSADKAMVLRIAQAASYAVHLKHSCVDLAVYHNLADPTLETLLHGITATDIKRLITNAMAPLVASPDGKQFWLQKYHAFEMSVAASLQKMHRERRLHIITGGPGTGKTWTASQRIQAALQENPQCVIALAAPTGRAANNMMAALANSQFDASQHGLKGLTLHALLGINGRSPKPRRDINNPLSCDLLIVDEASMIDVPMMFRLLNAVPAHARLILLGDKDQLASVEAGSVLADMCAAFDGGCVTTLRESRRYQHSPEIGVLAEALNRGDVPDMQDNGNVIPHPLSSDKPWEPAWLEPAKQAYAWIAVALANNTAIADMLAQQKQFQLLCALREGPYGVTGINTLVAKGLGKTPGSWYAGRPVMITQNDHDRKLYNGDVGLVLPVGDTLKACFMVDGVVKTISQAQMPAHDSCYAITVHKSQGSEYEHVMIVLPADVNAVHANPVLTRELVYTAVTRARSRIDLWSGAGVLQAAAEKTTQRMSGLTFFMGGGRGMVQS